MLGPLPGTIATPWALAIFGDTLFFPDNNGIVMAGPLF
jgi:hypothetical protein